MCLKNQRGKTFKNNELSLIKVKGNSSTENKAKIQPQIKSSRRSKNRRSELCRNLNQTSYFSIIKG